MSDERIEVLKSNIGKSAAANMDMLDQEEVMELIERSVESLLELRNALEEGGAERLQRITFIVGIIVSAVVEDL